MKKDLIPRADKMRKYYGEKRVRCLNMYLTSQVHFKCYKNKN